MTTDQPPNATELARSGTITEQNKLLAKAYDALLEARDAVHRQWSDSGDDGPYWAVKNAIEAIENHRQKREPTTTEKST